MAGFTFFEIRKSSIGAAFGAFLVEEWRGYQSSQNNRGLSPLALQALSLELCSLK